MLNEGGIQDNKTPKRGKVFHSVIEHITFECEKSVFSKPPNNTFDNVSGRRIVSYCPAFPLFPFDA